MITRARVSMIFFALVAIAMLAVASCGGDDAGDDGGEGSAATSATASATAASANSSTAADSTATPAPDSGTSASSSPAPGRILVTSSAITGQEGKLLIVIGPVNGSRLCAAVDSDPWTLDPTPLTDLAPDSPPCGEETAETLFEPGEHFVSAGLLVPGDRESELSTAAGVQLVDGDAVIQLDGSKLSAGAQVGAPGRIMVSTSEISGQSGKILIVMGQSNSGSACASIDSDSWSLSSPLVLRELPGGDVGPCGEGTPEVAFGAGDTVVSASVFVPGERVPRLTTQMLVTVDGDVTASVDGGLLSAP